MRAGPLTPFLERFGYVVLDGGVATALEERGHRLDDALWSGRVLLESPEAIAEVHRAYVRAGAHCITTASYQVSFPGFEAAGLDADDCREALRRSVALALAARDAAEPDAALAPLVAASVGPYGAYLADGSEYRGGYGVDRVALEEFHRERLTLLTASGADLLACETIPSLEEAEVLVALMEETPGAVGWVTFTCRDERTLSDGTPFADAVRLCAEASSVVGVGVNCTPPELIGPLLASVDGAVPVPFVVYPNSGELWDAVEKRWSGQGTAEPLLASAETWVEAGARVLGGCCRVGPGDIAGLGRVLAKSARAERPE